MNINHIRSNIYSSGYHTLKNYLSSDTVSRLAATWVSMDHYHFDNFIKNVDVKPGCNPYLYTRPTPKDFVFCQHIWNQPIDEELHEIAYDIQMMRNSIEGKPRFAGLHECHGTALQYRICRTVSEHAKVYPHADFFEESRQDPTGSHAFDPIRIQATLLLSTFNIDYKGGGFKLYNDTRTSYQLFGRDNCASAGDLIFWRYSLLHEVSDVQILNNGLGFLRIIFPVFEIN
jgi:hypothetical protein